MNREGTIVHQPDKKQRLSQFLKDNKQSFIITLVFILFAYGMKLFHIAISHDTEAAITVRDSLYESWLSFGRFGLILIKKIFDVYTYNPYIAIVFTLVTMLITAAVWQYLFYVLSPKHSKFASYSWILPVVFFTAPNMAEQISFMMQAFEVVFGMLLLGIASILIWSAIIEKKIWKYPLAIVCLVISYSVYQTMVPLFVAITIACFLLYFERQEKFWSVIFRLIACFIVSLVVYFIVSNLVMRFLNLTGSSYISEQIMWKHIPVKEGIENILKHIVDVVTFQGVYYTIAYPLALLAALVVIVCLFKKKYRKFGLYVLALCVFLITPFMMTALMGNAPTHRVQLVLPFVCGFMLQYFMNVISTTTIKLKKWILNISICVIGVLCLKQGMRLADMFNTEYVAYQEDVRLAIKISDRIDQLNLGENPKEPVVFIGTRTPNLNAATTSEYETIGMSFYQIAYGNSHGTFVMRNFMGTLGYKYVYPEEEQVKQGEVIAATMPSWPNTGSVIYQDGLIIVKLA